MHAIHAGVLLVEVGPSPLRWGVVAFVSAGVMIVFRRSMRWGPFVTQAGIMVFAFFAYFFVRGLTEGSERLAVHNANLVMDFERSVGLFHEERLQSLIIERQWLIDVFNWTYVWGHWPVIIVVATWLVLTRPDVFHRYRNAFLISGAIGLVIFSIFPVAPPRLASLDVVDTVTMHSDAYRALQPKALTNQYAAVPSLHFGWNLLIGMAVYGATTSRTVRVLAVGSPALMAVAVVLTGNHYLIDGILGAFVALAGLWLATHGRDWIESSSRDRDDAERMPAPYL